MNLDQPNKSSVFFGTIFHTGISPNTSDLDSKRIKILNFCSYFSLFVAIFFLGFNFITNELNPFRTGILISEIILFAITIFLQKKQQYLLARGIFIFIVYAILFLQTNIIYKEFYGEYLYLIIPLLSILFFDNSIVHLFLFLVAVISFYIPNLYLEIYPPAYFGYANALFLFMGTTYLVHFFKRENQRIEKNLQEKNNQVIEQKAMIEDAYQKLELSKKNELNTSKLVALKAQMNPHFIFNALNSIQYLILTKEIKSSNIYLGKFADLMRKILKVSNDDYTSLLEEIEILGLYLDLEHLRFEEDFSYHIHCGINEMQQDEIYLPSMFLQPYLENAIQHGLLHKKGKKELSIHFEIKNNSLICEIKDNGIGRKESARINAERTKYHIPFATKANKNRIDLMNENLNQKISLKTIDIYDNDTVSGTKIILDFPLKLV